MRKFPLLIILVLMLLVNSAFAFPPPSPDQERRADEQVKLCQSTGGIANKTYEGGYDPKTGIDRAWGVFVNCNCSEGYNWNSTVGCVRVEVDPIQKFDNPIQNQANTNLYFKIGILIISIFFMFWILRKK